MHFIKISIILIVLDIIFYRNSVSNPNKNDIKINVKKDLIKIFPDNNSGENDFETLKIIMKYNTRKWFR